MNTQEQAQKVVGRAAKKNISSGEDVILARDMTPEEQEAVEQWDKFIEEHEEMDNWYV